MSQLLSVYKVLLDLYGAQGWWPISSAGGYHPNNYTFPQSMDDQFEIAVGAILTQNTNWNNVAKSIENLKQLNMLKAKAIAVTELDYLAEQIKSSGYFNQKAKKLKIFAEFFEAADGRVPDRQELLDLWGIGPETADSILLYAYKIPTFVVDTYTKRIFSCLNIIQEDDSYETIKDLFEAHLPRDYTLYQEFHALIVKHAKNCYSKKPYGELCVIPKK